MLTIFNWLIKEKQNRFLFWKNETNKQTYQQQIIWFSFHRYIRIPNWTDRFNIDFALGLQENKATCCFNVNSDCIFLSFFLFHKNPINWFWAILFWINYHIYFCSVTLSGGERKKCVFFFFAVNKTNKAHVAAKSIISQLRANLVFKLHVSSSNVNLFC